MIPGRQLRDFVFKRAGKIALGCGAREVAGAVIAPDTMTRARALGIDPWDMLMRNDAHTFFERLGNQVITGPTLTNVNDFRAILVL